MPMPCKNRDGKRPCSACKEFKELTEFHLRPDGYHRGECKPCWALRSVRHREALNEWYDKLKDYPCLDCSVSYPPYVMEWDHLPQFEKVMNVSKMRVKRLKRETILAEIAKCELVCANCHAVRTYDRLSPEEQALVF